MQAKLGRTSSQEVFYSRELGVWRAGLGTGGTREHPWSESWTKEAYRWLLRQRPDVVFGTKGLRANRTPGVQVRPTLLQKFQDGTPMRRELRL